MIIDIKIILLHITGDNQWRSQKFSMERVRVEAL